MAVVGTVRHENETRECASFDYDMWDRIPEWKWDRIRKNSFDSRNSELYKEAVKRAVKSVAKRRGYLDTSYYTPKYRVGDIRVPKIVKDVGLYLLKGLL